MTILTKQTIIGFAFCTLLACNSKQPPEDQGKAGSNDTSAAPYLFNKNEEPYIVSKIYKDSIDQAGTTWNCVEMTNAKNATFKSCMPGGDPMEIGDHVLVGYNASGEPYIVAINKKNEEEPVVDR